MRGVWRVYWLMTRAVDDVRNAVNWAYRRQRPLLQYG